MENVKGTQRNNGNDWHKDCNKTQQPHWHSVGFQAARRGEPAVHKSLLKRCLSKGAVPSLPSAGLQLTWRPQERGYPDRLHSSAERRSWGGHSGKSHSQGYGSGQMEKFRIKRDLLKDLKGILDSQKR